jgi:hypothetical protein
MIYTLGIEGMMSCVKSQSREISIKNLRVLNPRGRMFFVVRAYTAYMDESYVDGALMCVGGWLCRDDGWGRIEHRWRQRIEYEQRRSVRANQAPIERYHASDLEHFRDEYKVGWDKARRTLFSKKLIDILSSEKVRLKNPIGIATGIKFPHILEAYPSAKKDRVFRIVWAAYRVCMMENLLILAETMKRAFPGEQVAVVYDRGPFKGAALSAFDSFKEGPTVNKRDIVTMAPMGWEDCTALQPADMICFESRKLINSGQKNLEQFRRSLQRIIGKGVMLRVRQISRESLLEIAEGQRLAPPPPKGWSSNNS